MLPYPGNTLSACRAAFCFHENALIRKKPECWTCSWCESGSERIVPDAREAQKCVATHIHPARNQPAMMPHSQPRAA